VVTGNRIGKVADQVELLKVKWTEASIPWPDFQCDVVAFERPMGEKRMVVVGEVLPH
jgi:hypothetical protein